MKETASKNTAEGWRRNGVHCLLGIITLQSRYQIYQTEKMLRMIKDERLVRRKLICVQTYNVFPSSRHRLTVSGRTWVPCCERQWNESPESGGLKWSVK